MSSVPGLRELLRMGLRDLRGQGPGPSLPELEADFREALRPRLIVMARLLAVVVSALTVIWWVLDFVRYRETRFLPNSVWRVGVLLCCAFAYWVVPRVGVLTRNALASLVGTGMGCVASIAYATGRMGGPEQPQFQFIHITLFATTIYPVSLRGRVVVTLLFAVTEFAAFFGPHPAYVHHPQFGNTISMMATTALLSIAVGYLVHRLHLRNFLQERALVDRAAEVDRLNAQLGERVMEQSEELRRLVAHIETSREAERTVLARELHDELGQELSALNFALALTHRRFEHDPKSVAANLRELSTLLTRTRETTRDVVRELRPRILDDIGLAAAVEWQARRSATRMGIEVHCELRCDEARLSPAVRIAAFRIVQEALTNIERHARASRATIRLLTEGESLHIEVLDDGIGLAERRLDRGAGLIGMRERATALSGRFVVENAPNSGTRIAVTLPVSDTEKMARA